jgi:hypothetical protein
MNPNAVVARGHWNGARRADRGRARRPTPSAPTPTAYLEELAALAQPTRSEHVLGTVPAESRVLLTAHDAFNYFGAAYGFEVVWHPGHLDRKRGGAAADRELVDMLVDRDIGAVFVESSVSDRNIRALIEGAAARGPRGRHRRRALLRRDGRTRHLRGHLYRHDRPQRDHHRRALGGDAPAGHGRDC